MFCTKLKNWGKIVTYSKSKYMNLDLSSMDGCKVFLLLHLKDAINIPHICYFTEKGKAIDINDLNHDLYGYVLLATIKLDQSWGKKLVMLNNNAYETVKKHCINQVKKILMDITLVQLVKYFLLDIPPPIPKMQYQDIQLIDLQRVSTY